MAAQWTFMTYMAGNKNLSAPPARTSRRCGRVGSSDDVKAGLQLDDPEVESEERAARRCGSKAPRRSASPRRRRLGATRKLIPRVRITRTAFVPDADLSNSLEGLLPKVVAVLVDARLNPITTPPSNRRRASTNEQRLGA
jgi:hypothetical protein